MKPYRVVVAQLIICVRRIQYTTGIEHGHLDDFTEVLDQIGYCFGRSYDTICTVPTEEEGSY